MCLSAIDGRAVIDGVTKIGVVGSQCQLADWARRDAETFLLAALYSRRKGLV